MAIVFGFSQRLAVLLVIRDYSRKRIAASDPLGLSIPHEERLQV